MEGLGFGTEGKPGGSACLGFRVGGLGLCGRIAPVPVGLGGFSRLTDAGFL